ncbi:DUF6528 family protein [Luteolibacter marinus]|uniref:DUF6528 family protein n=1 Tax=Luteolibacter marinus TaxID=2776705 RepID=UPI001866A4C3|nr:DUF6528 family protein [Luteolibacter marinus]
MPLILGRIATAYQEDPWKDDTRSPAYPRQMLQLCLSALLLVSPTLAGDFLLVCGGAEVFQLDSSVDPPAKRWSWTAKNCEELPAELANAFNTTDECKPVDGGKRLLVTSSGGGCILLELPAGKALWWARVPNAHSIEALPDGLIAVASSVGNAGNKVLLFDRRTPGKPLSEVMLPSAHGLVWDDQRKCLWALGFEELIACTLEENRLEVKSRHALPDKDGHDLRAIPGSSELVLSTHAGVWRFDRDKPGFRADPLLKDRLEIKSIDVHPVSGRTVTVQASGGNWWTDTIGFLRPDATLQLPDERLYKARWLTGSD